MPWIAVAGVAWLVVACVVADCDETDRGGLARTIAHAALWPLVLLVAMCRESWAILKGD